MRDFAYSVRGFLTVRNDSVRVPLTGSFALRTDTDLGLFTGDLAVQQATVSRRVLGVTLVTATVQITAESPVIGRVDNQGRLFATVTVDAAITAVSDAARWLTRGATCHTVSSAVVPLRSRPGFDLERGGRLAGRYYRPPFTGGGWVTPFVNLLASGPGNAAVIDLIPIPA